MNRLNPRVLALLWWVSELGVALIAAIAFGAMLVSLST